MNIGTQYKYTVKRFQELLCVILYCMFKYNTIIIWVIMQYKEVLSDDFDLDICGQGHDSEWSSKGLSPWSSFKKLLTIKVANYCIRSAQLSRKATLPPPPLLLNGRTTFIIVLLHNVESWHHMQTHVES